MRPAAREDAGMGEVVLIDAVRTPFGSLHGALAAWHPVALLATTLQALGMRTGVPLDAIGEVVVGCVEQVGAQGGNVGRAAVLAAGWPVTAGGSTLDRSAISGIAALAHVGALVASGAIPVGVAAAVDVPSLVPPGAAAMGRHPYGRPWEGTAPAHALVPPGRAAELLGVGRDRQDAWAAESRRRARAAWASGALAAELVVVEGVAADETIDAFDEHRDLASMPPMFDDDGTVTAGNSAAPADGAAVVLIADAAWAYDAGLVPLVSLHAALCTGAADDLLGAAAAATRRLGRAAADATTVEVPESSGALAVALVDALGRADRTADVNPRGGALAFGDPTATSSLRSVVTLAHRLPRGETGLAVGSGLGQGAAVVLHAAP
jgi:acetyl-CoA acyltransferase